MMLWLQVVLMFAMILIAAQVFTNALEHAGHRMGISAGVTGSIFAAVGTALPETLMPVLAIVAGTANHTVNEEIGVGAILGAPLMLSTLSIAIMGCSVLRKRSMTGYIKPERSGLVRDLNFFLVAFVIAAVAMYVPLKPLYFRVLLSVLLLGIYAVYLVMTCRASKKLVNEGHGVIPDEAMYFTKLGLPDNAMVIVSQLVVGLIILVLGAKGFIDAIANVADVLKISVLVLSLLIIPIATELPEKVNSILWVRKNKDTLAVGNITGAMVFQGTILPALGILLTPWQPSSDVINGIVIAFGAAFWLRLMALKQGIPIYALFINGMLYVLYLGLTFY